jgi:hypothetical protein
MELELPESASIWFTVFGFLVVIVLQFMRHFDIAFHRFCSGIFLIIEISVGIEFVVFTLATFGPMPFHLQPFGNAPYQSEMFLGDYAKMNMWRSFYIASTIVTSMMSLYLITLRIYFQYRSKPVHKPKSE